MRAHEKTKSALLLTVLALSLTGCASPSKSDLQPSQLPPPPQLTTPLPQQTYSESVQQSLQRWREKLTDTP